MKSVTAKALVRLVPLLMLLPCAGVQACSGRLHIEVRDSGVYALDYAAIVAAQPSFTDCAAADLQLTQRGAEVPLRVSGERDGKFTQGSRIEWLGQALHGPQSWFDPYSVVNVYQLGAAPGVHARLQEAPVALQNAAALRHTLHFEQENLLLRLSDHEMKPGDEPDVWQWAKLTPVDAHPFAFTFDVPDVDLRTAAARTSLTLSLRGMSGVLPVEHQAKPLDHVLELTFNGKPLPSLSWDGRDELRKTLELPPGLLKEHDNTLTARVPKRASPKDAADFIVDVVMFNWLEVDFPGRGDLSTTAAFRADGTGVATVRSADATTELIGSDGSYQNAQSAGNGAFHAHVARGVDYYVADIAHQRIPALRAIAVADPHAAEPGYDYLIVAHPSLLEAIAPLAEYHRAHGLHVGVFDVDDVYDAFGGGIAHPAAIRDLVAWGTEHWTVKPRYLLLVGDASTDIHHAPADGQLSGASYALATAPTPAQMLGSGFGGMRSYAYPDKDKRTGSRNLIPTWQYPSPEGQSASDNDFVALKPGDFHPTLAVGRFPVTEPAEVKAIVDKTLAYLNKPGSGEWRRALTFISTSEVPAFKETSDKIATDLEQRGFATTNIYTDFNERDTARYQQVRAALRENFDAGKLLVHFIGHGGSYIWRVGPVGDLFTLDDVSALNNANRYPMVLAMTCFSAPFDNPTDDSIGERFLREADRGAVAVYAASWKNVPVPQYSQDLIAQLLKPGNRIGDAVVAAKGKILARDFVEIYNLLGDPALVLAQPQGQLEFARPEGRWDRRLVVRVPASDFGGDVDVDWLDAAGAVLASTRYQSRDAQFALTPPAHARSVRVYAMDARNGYTAFGALNLAPPPPPKVITVAPPKAPAGPPPPPHVWDPRDDITQHNFEDAPAHAAPPAAAPHQP